MKYCAVVFLLGFADGLHSEGQRRRWIQGAIPALAAVLLPPPSPASSPMDLAPMFTEVERNRQINSILASKPFEMLRILEQESVDDTKYGGELSLSFDQPPSSVILLIPIAIIEAKLRAIRADVADPKKWDAMRKELGAPPFEKKAFKKAFNAFADNIYYSSESMSANAYLGGGATPSTTQTVQYMLRNEVLGNVELAEAELGYLVRVRDDGSVGADALVGEELDDLKEFLDKALDALGQYLAIPPAADTAVARKAALSPVAMAGLKQAGS